MVSLERGGERDVEAKVRYLVYSQESRESRNKRERREREEGSVCSREDGMYIRKVSICNFLCSGLNTVII